MKIRVSSITWSLFVCLIRISEIIMESRKFGLPKKRTWTQRKDHAHLGICCPRFFDWRIKRDFFLFCLPSFTRFLFNLSLEFWLEGESVETTYYRLRLLRKPNLVFLDKSLDLIAHAVSKVMYGELVIFTLEPRTFEVVVLKKWSLQAGAEWFRVQFSLQTTLLKKKNERKIDQNHFQCRILNNVLSKASKISTITCKEDGWVYYISLPRSLAKRHSSFPRWDPNMDDYQQNFERTSQYPPFDTLPKT